ncbi:MAG TPA: hypothetical protein VGR13_05545, partial [Actinomycetota bacterium]|nr:hypothetical protein [Actinomycetota bacterium]
FLSNTQGDSWGRNLPTDRQSRANPLLPPFKPDPIIKDAVRRTACMGQESPAVLKRRLLDIYAQPDMRARIAALKSEPGRVDLHLSGTIWLVLPALHRDPDRHVPIEELTVTG